VRGEQIRPQVRLAITTHATQPLKVLTVHQSQVTTDLSHDLYQAWSVQVDQHIFMWTLRVVFKRKRGAIYLGRIIAGPSPSGASRMFPDSNKLSWMDCPWSVLDPDTLFRAVG
jgi:hypothetical protein